APRTDYMAMLDRRLKKMEERLIKCIPKSEAAAVVAATGRSVLKPAVGQQGRKRTMDEAFAGRELEEWSRRGGAKMARTGEGLDGTAVARIDPMDDGSQALPPLELQIHLAEVYFEYLY